MKKIILIAGMIGLFQQAEAQWLADGTQISSTFTMTDLNGTTHDAFTLFNQGKHLVIDFSATWCGPCFTYHQTKVLDYYYNKYGPTGTAVKDAQVIFYEVDPSTTLADLQGTGGNTQGDWLTGTTHPVCNPSNASSVISKFLTPGTTSYGVPAVFVVCKDKKLYRISTGITTESGLRNTIASKCGVAPLSNDEIMDEHFSYELFPNPAGQLATLRLNLDQQSTVSYIITNSLGERMDSKTLNLNMGQSSIEFSTANWSSGIYFIQLQVDEKVLNTRLSVSH
jgi:thiol-disulfide isomerase/thioredoxin